MSSRLTLQNHCAVLGGTAIYAMIWEHCFCRNHLFDRPRDIALIRLAAEDLAATQQRDARLIHATYVYVRFCCKSQDPYFIAQLLSPPSNAVSLPLTRCISPWPIRQSRTIMGNTKHATQQVPSLDHAPKGVLEDGSLDPVYAAKARVLNKAIQEIGMGRYQRQLFIVIGFGWAIVGLCEHEMHSTMSERLPIYKQQKQRDLLVF